MAGENLEKLSSKDRALLTLKAVFRNSSPMVSSSYVIEKIEDCIGNPSPEQLLDEKNRKTFDDSLKGGDLDGVL